MDNDQQSKLFAYESRESNVAQSRNDSAKPRSLWQNLRRHPKVFGYCFALTSGILLWGYDMAMTGNLASLPEFQYVQSPASYPIL